MCLDLASLLLTPLDVPVKCYLYLLERQGVHKICSRPDCSLERAKMVSSLYLCLHRGFCVLALAIQLRCRQRVNGNQNIWKNYRFLYLWSFSPPYQESANMILTSFEIHCQRITVKYRMCVL